MTQEPVPEVYTAIPPQPKEKKPGQLERWQVEQYFDQGFLIVPSFFTNAELEPVIKVSMYKTSSFVCVYLHFGYSTTVK